MQAYTEKPATSHVEEQIVGIVELYCIVQIFLIKIKLEKLKKMQRFIINKPTWSVSFGHSKFTLNRKPYLILSFIPM